MDSPKHILREQARKHRAWIVPSASDLEAAAAHFFENISLQETPAVIAAYWPKGREFDPLEILERAHDLGYTCALPEVIEGSKILKFRKWTPGCAMREGAFGIPVPNIDEESVIPDIVIVPLLAFDRRGYRLGQGGSYYDATLESLRAQKNIQAVGLGYASQAVLFNLPVEAHDQKLDWVITPQEAQRF